MNPFFIAKKIREGKQDGPLTIDALSRLCGFRVRHAYVKMSDAMFECAECGGFPRHWVERLQLHSWISLWFYNPEKQKEKAKAIAKARAEERAKKKSKLEDAQDLRELFTENDIQDAVPEDEIIEGKEKL